MSARWQCAALVAVCAVGAATCQQAPPPKQAAGSSAAAPTAPPGQAVEGAGAPSPGGPAAGVAEAPVTAAPAPPEPEYREVTVPAGTSLAVVLDTTVSSDGSNVEDPVRGHLANAVRVDGVTVIPGGSTLSGSVVEARASGKVKGRGRVAFRFNRITVHGESHGARTSVHTVQAKATKGKDAKKIGVGAGAGAVVGALIGGGKGAAIGAGVGGGVGTGVVLATKGQEASVASGAQVRVTLQEPISVRVPVAPAK